VRGRDFQQKDERWTVSETNNTPTALLNGRLEDPRTAAALARLLDRAEELERLLTAVAEGVKFGRGMVATAVDVADEQAQKLTDEGIDPAQAVLGGLRAALWLGGRIKARELEALGVLLRSDVLAPEAVAVVAGAADALVESRGEGEEAPRVGLFGLLRSLSDPDVQRSLGFLLRFAKNFGRILNKGDGEDRNARRET
jgi:hypothetical protein